MSAIIEKIRLENWFNYKGDYETNSIDFGEGLNIIIGDNNGGKTKLHNAIRFILANNVVLKKNDKFNKFKVDATNVLDVLNQRAYLTLEINKSICLGVKLYFRLTQAGDTTRYLLKREIKIRKTEDGPKILEEAESVYIVNNISLAEIKQPKEKYDIFCNILMPEKSRNYFFLDGEQLGLMTPLEGPELKKTINSIIKLSKVDEIVDNFLRISKSIKSKKEEILENNDELTAELEETADILKGLPKQIEIQEKVVDELITMISDQEKIKEEYEEQAIREKESHAIFKTYSDLKSKLDISENNFINEQRKFISCYFDKGLFYISALNDDIKSQDNLASYIEKVKTFVSERKTELDPLITPEEAYMMNALDRSQPKPAILQQMVDVKKCFVCKSDLNPSSIDWINNKLLPFFNNDNSHDEDENLNKLITIKEFASQLFNISKKHFKFDINVFDGKKYDVIEALAEYNRKKQLLEDFINQYGEPDSEKSEDVAIITYSEAIKKIEKLNIQLESQKGILDDLHSTQNECITKLSMASKGKSRSNLEKINDLDEFLDATKLKFEQIKENRYTEFAISLSQKATERFRNFFKRSAMTKNQEIKVVLLSSTTSKGKDYNFKIEVVNSFGEDETNAGGGSQAMRQVAVVFGLIDLSGVSSCPFIVDAPTSDLSGPQTESFFEQIGQDTALRQTILLTMDLFDDSTKGLNLLGEKVLKKIQGMASSKMIYLQPKGENSGVVFNYLKN
jgi:DNA sulfur modification protein DndD